MRGVHLVGDVMADAGLHADGEQVTRPRRTGAGVWFQGATGDNAGPASDGDPGLPGVPEPDGERAADADWFLWPPGGDHHPGGACLTLRENTERPVTVTQGTNTVVGCDPKRIVTEVLAVSNDQCRVGEVPEL